MKKYQYLASWDDQTLTRVGEPVVVLGDSNVSQVEVTLPSNFLLDPTKAECRMYFLLPGEKESDHDVLEAATKDENGDSHVTWTIKHVHSQKGGRLAFSLTLIGDNAQWDSRTAIIPVYESRYQPESEEAEKPYTGRLTALEGSMAAIRGEFAEVQDDFEELKETATLGAPIPESLVANMQAGHVYIYTGTELGYTAGHVYYYVNGTLTDGGVYGGTAVDATLTQSGKAADAAAVGAEVSAIKEDLADIQTATTDDVGRALKVKTVTDGKVTEWEFGEAGGSVDTDKTLTESDMPADSGVTGRYIRAILNLLKGATYDQSKIANAEHAIDMLDIEIFGIYTLPAPLVCDADQFIDTGFSVTSTEDYGYANDWYILLDAKIDAVSKIFGNRSWWFERQQSAANNSMLVVKAPNYNVEAKIGGQVLRNRFKYAITYDHTRHKITAHGVNNNTLVSVLANYNLPSAWGPLMIGGSTEESFRGTIYQLDVRLGTLTESEIKAYLGVE